MKSAGIALANNRVIVAVIINSSVHIHRVKDLNEAKSILETAKPDVVGMDISSANIYEDLKYSFNAIKVERMTSAQLGEIIKKLTFLNIKKEDDGNAIGAAYAALENSKN